MDVNDEFGDQELCCTDCGATFLFSFGEARFFASRNLATPRRCEPCRKAKRQRFAEAELAPEANARSADISLQQSLAARAAAIRSRMLAPRPH